MGKPGFPILLPVGVASLPHREGLEGEVLPIWDAGGTPALPGCLSECSSA